MGKAGACGIVSPMSKLRVLVANEPRTYREAMACAVRELRPNVEVLTVEPEALESEVKRGVPALVLCSRATSAVQESSLAWVELYPDGKPQATLSVDGLCLTAVNDLGMPNLVWIVDHAQLMLQRGRVERAG